MVNVLARQLKTGDPTNIYSAMPDDIMLYCFGNGMNSSRGRFHRKFLCDRLSEMNVFNSVNRKVQQRHQCYLTSLFIVCCREVQEGRSSSRPLVHSVPGPDPDHTPECQPPELLTCLPGWQLLWREHHSPQWDLQAFFNKSFTVSRGNLLLFRVYF